MGGDAAGWEVQAEAVVFLRYFEELPDTRQRGKVMYPLDEVPLLCLLAVLAGAETFVDIARFGDKKLELLRRFRPFVEGTPSHDHLGDIFATLDAEHFQRCFVNWVASQTGVATEVIAIEPAPAKAGGKTVRRSHHRKGGKAAIHMVSAFAARQRLVLGQIKVAERQGRGAEASAASCIDWAARLIGVEGLAAFFALAEEVGPASGAELFLPYLPGERTPHNDPVSAERFWVLATKPIRAVWRPPFTGAILIEPKPHEPAKHLNAISNIFSV